jgi:WD40 repeat protein
LRVLQGHTDRVSSVAFSPDSQYLATAGIDKTVRVWGPAVSEELLTLPGHTEPVNQVIFSPDGRRLASASEDKTVKIWDAYHDQTELTFGGHRHEMTRVAFGPGGQRLATAGVDSVIKLWEAHTGRLLLTLRGHTNVVNDVAFSPDGQRLASASHDGTVKLWDPHTGRPLDTLRGHAGLVHSVAFSGDGKWLASGSAGYDRAGKKLDNGQGEVRLWEAATGQEAALFRGGAGAVYGLAFSPDNAHLAVATGGDRTVKVLAVPSGAVALTLPHQGEAGMPATLFERLDGHQYPLFWQTLVYSPDGRQLALVNGERGIKVWDAITGREVLTIPGVAQQPNAHGNVYVAVAFSPDGKRLVAADTNGVTLFDAHTGLEIQIPQPRKVANETGKQRGKVQSIAFSRDGQRLALVTGHFYLTVLDVRPLTPEIRAEREALELLRYLLHGKLLSPEEAQESVRKDPTLHEAVRQKALDLAKHYRGETNTGEESLLGMVLFPGRGDDFYRLALRHCENGCRADPDSGTRFSTLGIVLYRVGQYQKALDALLHADRLNAEAFGGSLTLDLAFVAMCHHQLGHREQAQAYLKHARGSIKEYPTRRDYGGYSRFPLQEAEALIEGKTNEPNK